MPQNTYSVSEAQARLHALIKTKRLLAVTRAGELQAYIVPAALMTVLMETHELMGDGRFRKALKEYESGTPVKWKGVHAILDGTAPKA